MAVYLPVWHSHCTRARFAVLVSCSDELAVHHVRSFACRGRLRTFRADCSIISLCCVTTTWQLLFPSGYGRRRFVACDCWTQTSCAVSAARQWLLTAVCHVVLYCVKRSIAVPTKRIFRDCCRNMGHFLSGVERAKRFVNVLSHRTVTNLKKIREMSTLPPWKILCGSPWPPVMRLAICAGEVSCGRSKLTAAFARSVAAATQAAI